MATIRGDPKARPIRVRPTPIKPARIETGSYKIIEGGTPYEGEYTVVPQAYDATILDTQGKVLSDDVIVTAIPYYETTNPQGGYTVTIG
ncbi:MAG: hypothetical protein IJS25_07295 [Bacteroidales bacterium]|nr:hypothetical protein [Bacteroidales bacterium]